MIEAIYKDKSGHTFELWTSKYGTPYITRCLANGMAIMSFEFSNTEERAESIKKLVKMGKIYKIS